jgi:hypothetical protein
MRSLFTTPAAAASAEADAIFEKVRPLFAGHQPDVQGTALAQLTAMWLAGFQGPADVEAFRVEMMDLFVGLVIKFTPLMEEEYVTPQLKGRTPEA